MPIYFILHGQSEFNAVHKEGDNDPLIFDAPLTDKGRRQAEEAKVLVADLGSQLETLLEENGRTNRPEKPTVGERLCFLIT